MSNGKILFVIFIVIIFLSFFSFQSKKIDHNIPLPIVDLSEKNKLAKMYSANANEIVFQDFIVNGFSMEPLLKNGTQVKVMLNYYNHNKNIVKNGDIVIFENPFSNDKIIKKVLLSPGTLVKKDTNHNTLIVDGKVLNNSIGRPYIFDQYAYKFIDNYTKSGAITQNTYFLFGDNVFGSVDSRKTGPVTLEGILGKVIYPDNDFVSGSGVKRNN